MRLKRHLVSTPDQRVKLIEGQIRESVHTGEVLWLRAFLRRTVLLGVPARDDEAAVRAIFRWSKDNIRYEQDPTGLDLYPTARSVVAMGVGDCDCHTILNSSALAAIGFDVGCRVIQDQVRGFHIYALAGLPRGNPVLWVPVDSAWEGVDDIGEEYPPNRTVYRMDWIFELEG